jgi:hypothetical protein
MDLFDVVRTMFCGGYSLVTRHNKARSAFMVNRLMSVKHPVQAAALNRSQLEPPAVVDYWESQVRGAGRVPGWVYTKSGVNTAKRKGSKPERRIVELWMKLNGVGEAELEEAERMDPDGLSSELKHLAKQVGDEEE